MILLWLILIPFAGGVLALLLARRNPSAPAFSASTSRTRST